MRYSIIAFLLSLSIVLSAENRMDLSFKVPKGWTSSIDRPVKAVAEDSFGFIWIGTENGVDRFDGYSRKSYVINAEESREDLVVSISEDGSGRLWIITKQGTYYYDRALDKVKEVPSEPIAGLGLPSDASILMIDSEKNLWATYGDRLFCHMFDGNRTIELDIKEYGAISDISAQPGTSIILFDNGSFYSVDLLRERLIPEGQVDLSSHRWHYVYLDRALNLWFYTAHSPVDGIKSYSLSERTWNSFPVLDTIADKIITNLIEDDDENVWIGTENEGIYVLSREDGTLDHYLKSQGSEQIPNNHVKKFLKDRNGNVWVTLGNGYVVYAETHHYVSRKLVIDSPEDISAIIEDKEGNLWIGTDGNGILRVSPSGERTIFSKSNGNTPADIITCLLVDRSGSIWAGTFGEGVLFYKNGAFHPLPEWDVSEATMSSIQSMAEDAQGRIMVGTIASGLYYISPETLEYNYFEGELQGQLSGVIRSMVSGTNGLLYINSVRDLIVYDSLEDRIVAKNNGLELRPGEELSCMYMDTKGRLWIGLKNGLCLIDNIRNRTIRLDTAFNLPSIRVYSICEDSFGNIWASSEHSLIRISEAKTTDDGPGFIFNHLDLDGITFKDDASIKTTGGQCLICSTDDVWEVNVQEGFMENKGNRLMFTGLYLYDSPVEVGDGTGILTRDISQTDRLRLKHDQSDFTLYLSDMDVARNHRGQYEYRVNGSSGQWIPLPDNRIQMNATNPGKYQLEARVNDLWGWIGDPLKMEIIIVPPFWKSWIAYLLYFLIALSLIVTWYIKDKNSHLLEQELAQQRELDENKMRFFTNINHDLKTPLTLIISPLEKMLQSGVSSKQDLELAYKNAISLKDEINRMLDVKALDAGAERIHLSRGDIVAFIKDQISTYKGYIDDHDISLAFSSDMESFEMDFDERKIRRILMNLISNSVKYNIKGGSVSVSLSKDGKDSIRLEVSDTGVGISDEDKKNIFNRFYQCDKDSAHTGNGIGLHIVKEYVNLLDGTITVEDNKPRGSRFIISLPVTIDPLVTDAAPDEDNQAKVPARKNRTGEDMKHILIVEDSNDLRSFLERCLEGSFITSSAANGREALEILKSESVDMVVSDIMMPEMDGLELCRTIKNNLEYSHIPVVLLTAKSTEKDVLEGLECGADEYVPKPFNIEILMFRIRKILEWTDANHRKIRKGISVEPKEITVSSLDEQLISKAIRIVEENMDNSLFSVEDLSREVGMTRGHLYKKMMFIMGISPVQFIRVVRMKRGKSLIEQGWTNISDVAYAVGYSPKQFAHHFKETFGCVPSQFLSSIKNKE